MCSQSVGQRRRRPQLLLLRLLPLLLTAAGAAGSFINSPLLAANQTGGPLLDDRLHRMPACHPTEQRLQFVRYAGVRVEPGLLERWAAHGLRSSRLPLLPEAAAGGGQPAEPASSEPGTGELGTPQLDRPGQWTVQRCFDACAADPHCHSILFRPTEAVCRLLPVSTGVLLRSHVLDQPTLHKGDSHYFEKLCLSRGELFVQTGFNTTGFKVYHETQVS